MCPLPGDGGYTGPNSVDPGKLGPKRHLFTDRNGVPLVLCITGANRRDPVVFEELIDALPRVAGKPSGARDEFLLAATAQNLLRMAKRWFIGEHQMDRAAT